MMGGRRTFPSIIDLRLKVQKCIDKLFLIVPIESTIRIKPRPFIAVLASVWLIVNTALHLGIIGLSSNQNGLPLPARLTLDAILLWIPITEVTLFCIVMSGLKGLWHSGRPQARPLAGILIPIAITFTAAILLAVTTGWVFRTHRLALPKPSLVSAAVVDLGSLAANMTSREVFYFIYAVGTSLLVASVLFRLTPRISALAWARLSTMTVVNCLALALLIRFAPTHFSERENKLSRLC